MNYDKIIVLVNAAAKSSCIDNIELKMACEHVNKFKPCQLIYTEGIADFISKAKTFSSEPGTLVAAAGGDGTINLALNEIQEDANIGLIPIGTANVIAKELGFPKKIRDMFKLLLTGAVQKIDLGLCCGKKFAFAAGIGFDAVVANSVSHKLKTYLGQAAYAVALFKTIINYKPSELTIECEDGKVLKGEFAIFANMRRYGGELYFAPEARYDDGILNLVLLKKFSFLNLLKLIKYAYGKGEFPKMAVKAEGKKFKVTALEPTYYELDGEVFGPEKTFDLEVKALAQGIITT